MSEFGREAGRQGGSKRVRVPEVSRGLDTPELGVSKIFPPTGDSSPLVLLPIYIYMYITTHHYTTHEDT